MIFSPGRWAVWGAAALLSACASAPLHYYTLVPAAADVGAEPATAQTPASLPFELLPVSVPAQVDQPQLVVRRGGQSVVLLSGERWIAPLSDELRSALSTDLTGQLHSRNVTGLPSSGQPRLRIKLDVQRFDSLPGSYALIDATWSVRLLSDTSASRSAPKTVACSSRVNESVGPGYDALVQGHQRAIAQVAAQIATAARALSAGTALVCPAS
ncbi:MAG: PqiC family protein [Rhodanobacter sp.]